MRIALDRLELEGFRSFRRAAVLDFRALPPGLIYLDGDNQLDPLQSNGAGKSTLFAAIEWCLYGSTGNEGAQLSRPDVASWGGDGDPHVALTLTRDNDALTIDRYGTRLLIDGRPAPQQEVINLLLPADVMMNALILGQGRDLFLDLAPSRRLAIFTAALGLDRFDRYAAAAKDRAALMAAAWAAHDAEAGKAGAVLAAQRTSSERLAAEAASWEAARQSRLDAAKAERKARIAQAGRIANLIAAAGLRHEEAALKLASLRPDRDKLFAAVERRSGQAQALKERRDAAAAGWAAAERLTASGSGPCPACGQPMKAAHIAKHRKQLLAVDTRLEAEYAKVTAQRQQLATKLAAYNRDIAAAEDAIYQAEAELNLQRPRHAELVAAINSWAEPRNEPNPYMAEIDALYTAMETVRDKRACGEAKASLAKRREARAASWIGGFREIKLDLVDEVLAEMQMAGNAMLPAIGLEGWHLGFATGKESKSGTVIRGIDATAHSPRNPKPVKWGCWSGGERQRLKLVGALALGEVLLANAGVEAGFEVLDEPCDHLSPGGVDAVVEFLAGRAARLGRQIFFADQNSLESGRFAAVVRVVKDGSGSAIHLE